MRKVKFPFDKPFAHFTGAQKRQAGLGLVESSLILEPKEIAEYTRLFALTHIKRLPAGE